MIPQTEFTQAVYIALTHTVDCPTDNRPAYRPDLRVVFFEFPDANTMRLIGTNGARLVSVDMTVQHGQPPASRVILSADDARKLITDMPADGRATVMPVGPDIMFLNGEVCRTYPTATVADIPDFNAVLDGCPDSQTGSLRVDCTYLAEAVTSCRQIADSIRILHTDGKPLYLRPKLKDGLTAIREVSIAIMYKGEV